jgi:hypothetical protein
MGELMFLTVLLIVALGEAKHKNVVHHLCCRVLGEACISTTVLTVLQCQDQQWQYCWYICSLLERWTDDYW